MDAIDIAILMHRDAHFGGRFDAMIRYYEEGGKGIHPDFTIARIQQLALMEQQAEQNLAATTLSGADAERVASAKASYKLLRDIYEVEKPESIHPRLIADLIFSEEDLPESEIAAIVAEGSAIVSALVELIRSDKFRDPLFPGYGAAPTVAAHCLGRIGDRRAITTLFETIGSDDFFAEETMLEALREIGEPAKKFLLSVLTSRPVNHDNERAAMALGSFKEDPVVGAACCRELLSGDINLAEPIASYLALACDAVDDDKLRKQLKVFTDDSKTPAMLQQDTKLAMKGWKTP